MRFKRKLSVIVQRTFVPLLQIKWVRRLIDEKETVGGVQNSEKRTNENHDADIERTTKTRKNAHSLSNLARSLFTGVEGLQQQSMRTKI